MAQRFPSFIFVCVALVGASLTPSLAHADERDRQETAAARSLFQQGLTRFDARDFTGAAEAFQRSYDLRASPVVGYNLASALREIGRWVDATEVLRTVIHADGAPGDVVRAAEQMLAELSPRLGHLVIAIDGPADSVELRLDDRPLSSAMIGARIPADPGTHRVTAWRDDASVAESAVEITEGGVANTTLVVPLVVPPVVPTAREAAATVVVPMSDPLAQDRDEPARPLRKSPWLWTAVGVVVVAGVVVATVIATRAPPPGDPVVGTTTPGVLTFP
jgi:hypothetical protein